jgi:indolepyruvate decarboxylase
MLATFQPESRFNHLDDWRFAEMCGPLGGDGVRVGSRAELQAALERAVATRGCFQLIEIMLAADARSATLQRFIEAQGRRSGMATTP